MKSAAKIPISISQILTGVSKVLVLLIRRKKNIVLGGLRLLLGEVLVLDLGKLDHSGGIGLTG